ncbi:Tn3 family transposase [Nonomuraea sp. NPDC023979]|uniref:Tn3 family transposase n=1 Tax=Nonomuraea sp. NPDC023979 TaxID=3154796 RepID=UPI00340CEA84
MDGCADSSDDDVLGNPVEDPESTQASDRYARPAPAWAARRNPSPDATGGLAGTIAGIANRFSTTAYTVLKQAKPSGKVKITAEDVEYGAQGGASVAGLRAGDTLTVEELRAVCLHLTGETVSLKEITAARNARRKQLRGRLATRATVVDTLLALHDEPLPAAYPATTVEQLRREINNGLQVVENWNGAHGKILYGREGPLTGSDREHAEVSMLALHLLQSSLVFINTQPGRSPTTTPKWASDCPTVRDRKSLPRSTRMPVGNPPAGPYGDVTNRRLYRLGFSGRPTGGHGSDTSGGTMGASCSALACLSAASLTGVPSLAEQRHGELEPPSSDRR